MNRSLETRRLVFKSLGVIPAVLLFVIPVLLYLTTRPMPLHITRSAFVTLFIALPLLGPIAWLTMFWLVNRHVFRCLLLRHASFRGVSCPNCLYPLSGAKRATTCPECGRAITGDERGLWLALAWVTRKRGAYRQNLLATRTRPPRHRNAYAVASSTTE